MKTKHWFAVGGAVVGLLLICYLAGGFSPGLPVEAAAAKVGPIRQFVDEQAVTRLPQTYLVTMPFNGRIQAIGLSEGSRIERDAVVAQIVPRDLELAVEQATAAVQQLEASIRENAFVRLEETALEQALKFVKATAETVSAAVERVNSSRAKVEYAVKNFGRIAKLFATPARPVSQDDLDVAELQRVQSESDYSQERFILAAMRAMQAATDLTPQMVRQYVERKKLSGDVLQQQKAEAESRLRQVLQEQQRGTLRSPLDGVVLNRFVSNEQFLAAGTRLLEIGRLEDLEVEADVLSLDVVEAKPGQSVEIYGPAVGRSAVTGTVARIYPAGFTKLSSLGVEQQRVKVVVRFSESDLRRLLKDRRLGVGYRVRARIFTAENPQALVVPRSALVGGTDGKWQLFAIRKGRAQLQPVRVGLLNDELAEITSGLVQGDLVVLAPQSNLADGVRVSPRVEEPSASQDPRSNNQNN